MDSAHAFGVALRRRRLEAGITQEQLALGAGVGRVYVSWLESGKRQPTFHTIVKLAASLGCPAGLLVSEAEELMSEPEASAK